MLTLWVIAWFCVFPSSGPFADIYKWKDADGNWHFSDTPEEAPEGSTTIGEIPASPELQSDQGVRSESSRSEAADAAGMFWRIEKPGIRPSFILGTLHSEDQRVLRILEGAESQFLSVGTLIMETVLDDSALFKMSTAMLYPDDRTLLSVIGESLYLKATKVASEYGVGEFALNKMKPWAVFSLLSVPKPKTGMFMDMVLYQRAKSSGKRIEGLESVEEQLSVFDTMTEPDQIALLEEALDQFYRLPVMSENLIKAYISGDLNRVATLAAGYMKSEKHQEIMDRLMLRVNDERNMKMIRRLEPRLAEGNVFTAVGALHLPGENGLLNLIKRLGYDLAAIKTD
jgi:hypothetical protein